MYSGVVYRTTCDSYSTPCAVANVPWDIDSSTLRSILSEAGPVREITLLVCWTQHRTLSVVCHYTALRARVAR